MLWATASGRSCPSRPSATAPMIRTTRASSTSTPSTATSCPSTRCSRTWRVCALAARHFRREQLQVVWRQLVDALGGGVLGDLGGDRGIELAFKLRVVFAKPGFRGEAAGVELVDARNREACDELVGALGLRPIGPMAVEVQEAPEAARLRGQAVDLRDVVIRRADDRKAGLDHVVDGIDSRGRTERQRSNLRHVVDPAGKAVAHVGARLVTRL